MSPELNNGLIAHFKGAKILLLQHTQHTMVEIGTCVSIGTASMLVDIPILSIFPF